MDLITHGLLGACVGQCIGRKTLGRRALYWGIIAGTLPDWDMIVSLSHDPLAVLLYHRGITHSLLGAALGGLLGGWLVCRLYRRSRPHDLYIVWISLFIMCLLTHILLDCFTTYGTQLLAPWSDRRFSLDAIGIIDPFYTVPFLIPFIIGTRNKHIHSLSSAPLILILTTTYLFWGLYQNSKAIDLAMTQFKGESIDSIHSYPTILQIFLRRVIVHTPHDIRVGFISTWAPQPIHWYVEKTIQPQDAQTFLEHKFAKVFAWFTENQYLIVKARNPSGGSVIAMTDLRFGYPGKTMLGIWKLEDGADGRTTSPSFVSASPGFSTILKGLKAAFIYDPSFFEARKL